MISKGQYIIIQRENFMKITKFENDSVKLGDLTVDLSNAVGKPFWTTFKMVQSSGKKKLVSLEVQNDIIDLSSSLLKDSASCSDNRNIVDNNTSQKLSKEDLTKLKEEGTSGQDILSQLIENSSSFTGKTEYAQEKYIKKKQKKYSEYICILKPTLRLVTQIHFTQDPGRILYLRTDTLAQILSNCDIKSGASCILYESACSGLMGAAMLERLGGKGNLIDLHLGNIPQRHCVHSMNFSQEQLSCLKSLDIRFIFKTIKTPSTPIGVDQSAILITPQETDSFVQTVDILVSTELPDEIVAPPMEASDNGAGENGVGKAGKKRKLKEPEDKATKKQRNADLLSITAEDNKCSLSLLTSMQHDCLVIACKEHPLPFIELLFDFVAPSRPFVIYSQFTEPLMECFTHLKNSGEAINLKIHENWLRNYQVLPERTHPEINMSGGGGYLLTGVKVKR